MTHISTILEDSEDLQDALNDEFYTAQGDTMTDAEFREDKWTCEIAEASAFCTTCGHPTDYCTCGACTEDAVTSEDMSELFAR
jgi:hypothetical protein